MRFEWDEEKAASNLAKHGVSFDEAKTVFDDPLFLDYYDPEMVAYTERGDAVRLISSRATTTKERRFYEGTTTGRS